MSRTLELRRHTDNDGDVLSPEGVASALRVGGQLARSYDVVVSTGAQRATQTAACFLATGVTARRGVQVHTGVRSDDEDRWRDAYQQADSGELAAMREAVPDWVEEDAKRLGAALREILDELPDGGSALVVGHSPTNEAAVYGLTGEVVGSLSKGAGVRVTADGDGFVVEELPVSDS